MNRIYSTIIGCAMAVAASAQVVLVTSAPREGASHLAVDQSANNLQFTSAEGQKTVSVNTNLKYALNTGKAQWCTTTINPDGSFAVKVEANAGKEARQATLNLVARDNNSHTYEISQLGSAPSILSNAQKITLSDNATDFTVTLTTNTEVDVKTPEWITTSSSNKDGDYTVTYSFKATQLAQAGTSRTDNITVSDKAGKAKSLTISVEQSFRGYPRFAVISDTHFGNNVGEGPMVKVPKALKNLQNCGEKLDAIFICGDLTDWGNPDQYVKFKKVFDDRSIMPADLPVYVMMGNHDNYADNALKNYLVLNQPYHQLIDIKGYPFITTSMDGGSWSDYAPEEIQALADNLARAAKNYPGKPIFVFTHVPPTNTVYGSCQGEGGWGTSVYDNVLKKYPQVVLFAGHSHFPLADPRSIDQTNYTTINDGSCTYSEIEPGVVNEGIHPAKYDYVTEGCIVNVDKASNVEVERWDTYTNEEILPRWYINAPHDGSQFVYTKARKGGDAPKWAADSKVEVTKVENEGCTVSFPQATDDENVHHYVIELVEKGSDEVLANHGIFSGYYLNSRAPKSFTVRLEGIPNGKTLTARVKALDSYKNASEYIVSEAFTTTKYVPSPDAKMPTADLFDIQFGKNGTATDASANGVKVLHGNSLPNTSLNETTNRYVASFTGSNQCFYRVNYNDNEKIKNALKNGFSIEVNYKPNTTGNVCPLSAQEGGGCGIEQASGGLIQFYCHVGGGYKVLKSTVTAEVGKSYHVVAVYDKKAQKTRIFVNGSPAGEMDAKGDFDFPSNEAAHWFAIGGDAHTSSNCQYALEGEISVARMYTSALSRDEAYLLYEDATGANYHPSADAKKPTADLFNLEFGDNGNVSDVSSRHISVKTGTEAPKTSLNETYNRTQATFAGSRQSFYRVDYANDETMQKAFNNGFSFEVLYKPTNTNNVCPMSAQESGGCGIEQASGGLIQFYCHIGGSYKVLKSNVKAKANHYYHVVAVYDKDKAQTRIYIDGEPAGEMVAEGSYGFPPKKEAWWIAVGGDAHTSENAQYNLSGDVVIARMYGKTLNRDEAFLLFKDVVKK